MIREALLAHGITTPLNFSTQIPAYGLSPTDPVSFGVRHDDLMDVDRLFVQTPTQILESAGQSPAPSTASASSSICNTVHEYFTVLDFVLALEHVCRDHIEHPSLYTRASHVPRAEGHFLTTSTHVLGYAPQETSPDAGASWEIPYAEIDKLIQFSEALELEDEITPVQAWQTLKLLTGREIDPNVLRSIQSQLVKVAKCCG